MIIDKVVFRQYNGSLYKVIQSWVVFSGYSMGRLYCYRDKKLFLTATIKKPLSKEELIEYLNNILKKE